MRVPAVVGSWPEPFLQHSADEERLPVRVECAGERESCRVAADRLSDEGVSVSQMPFGRDPGGEALRVLVGPWGAIKRDPGAAQVDDGPSSSGVFADFASAGAGLELVALSERAEPASRLGAGAGLVAAVRDGERPPTWLVSGVDDAGVRAAAAALDEDVLTGPLRRRGRGGERREPAGAGGGGLVTSALAYAPRATPLGRAAAGAAAIHLWSFAAIAFVVSNPIVLAGCALAVVDRRPRGRRAARRSRSPRAGGRRWESSSWP